MAAGRGVAYGEARELWRLVGERVAGMLLESRCGKKFR